MIRKLGSYSVHNRARDFRRALQFKSLDWVAKGLIWFNVHVLEPDSDSHRVA